MSQQRSRSPKDNKGDKSEVDVEFKNQIWADFETKLDAKNEVVFKEVKEEVKNVVGSLVSREIERIKTTIAINQKINEANMASLEKMMTSLCLWRLLSSMQSKTTSPLMLPQVPCPAQVLCILSQ